MDSSAGAALHMVRVALDAPVMVRWARQRHLPLWQLDEGYIAHCALDELFGPGAIRPFAMDDVAGRSWTVLGYASHSGEVLKDRARAAAEPELFARCDWSQFVSKPMPAEWSIGARFAFRLRSCPVVRMNADGAHYRKGAEVDAFLAHCWSVGDGVVVDRAAVYVEWLRARLERGGARLEKVEVASFRRARLLRRQQGGERTPSLVERPAVVFRGVLEIAEPALFGALLQQGVGRHRAFGFGMLQLAHPRRQR